MSYELLYKLLHKSMNGQRRRAPSEYTSDMRSSLQLINARRTRRQVIAGAAGVALAALLRWPAQVFALQTEPSTRRSDQRYKISASDWMLLKRQKPGALPLARDCGLDGIEVDMGSLGKRPDFENHLREEDFRTKYIQQAKSLGLEISSLAMSAFYGQPFAEHPSAEQFAKDWIALMTQLGTKVGFLPLISKADLVSDADARKKVVELFKQIAPEAEKASVIVGINTQLDSANNKKLLDDIGSANVRIAYNIGEAVDAKRDVYSELHDLGRHRIAQIIPTLSDGQWLENDSRIDVPKLKSVLEEIGWSGWFVLQRSRMKGKKVAENFSANAKYLKSIFQA
jgi:sugar phosphate isomerase/epimerase